MDMNIIFDGIGTEIIGIIISFIIGAVGGGVAGYKIGVKRTSKQKQIAGDDSKQRQELRVDNTDAMNGSVKMKEKINQYQEAGDNAEQVQIGEVSIQTHDNQRDDGGDG